MSLKVTNSSNTSITGAASSVGSRVETSSPFTESRALGKITGSSDFKSNFVSRRGGLESANASRSMSVIHNQMA